MHTVPSCFNLPAPAHIGAGASSASTPAPAHSRVSTMVPGGGGDEEDLDIGGSGSKALECCECKESHAAHMMWHCRVSAIASCCSIAGTSERT